MENIKQNKFEKNRNYYTISVYAVAVIVISAILIKLFLNWGSTIIAVKKIISVLMPYIIGMFIAYLINPLVKKTDSFIYTKLHIKKKGIRTGISILFSYLVVFGIIVLCIIFIIPQIYESLKTIYVGTQSSYDKLLNYIDKLNAKYPQFDLSYVSTVLENNSASIINFIKGSLDTLLPLLYNTSISVVSWAIDIIIAIMVSVYLLIDRNRMINNSRRFIYATFKKEKAAGIISTLSECNKIFSGFIIGKAIDSMIIGFMCFAFMNILGLKYSVLISVIVGITNMIPYFGPFIGAIPGVLILLTVGFNHALVFGILIFALQQFDGLYLGPNILGDSTGLRPVWIIFAITIGGWVAGPIGMFLGVPCVAVIAFLTERAVAKRLIKNNVTTEDYLLEDDYYIDKNNQNNTDSQSANDDAIQQSTTDKLDLN